jgi:signal transduction histidine kinase
MVFLRDFEGIPVQRAVSMKRSLVTYAVVTGVLAVLVLGVACAVLARSYNVPFPGFLAYRSGAVTSLWRAEWPGRRAGLRARDIVITVDGTPVSSGAEIAAALDRHGDGGTLVLEVRSPASRMWPSRIGPVHRVELPVGRLLPWDLGYTLFLPFSIGILYLLLGAVIYGFKPGPASALATALCLLAAAFYLTMFDAHTTYRFTRVWLLYPFFGPLSIHLFSLFPEKHPRWARRRVLVPMYLVGAAVVAWRQLVIDNPAGSDLASLVSSIILSFMFTADLALLADAMLRGSSPAVRNRAVNIFAGLGLTCGASVVWQFASRIGPPHLPMSADQAMLLSALFPILIAYAILKRNLFDFDAVLRASLGYFLTTAVVLGVYFGVVAVAGNIAASLFGHSTGVAVGSTLIAALCFHPVRLQAQRIVDRLWVRDRGGPDLVELLRALSSVDGVQALADRALGPLRRLTGARGVVLLVRARGRLELAGHEGEGELASRVAGAAVPIGGALERAFAERPEPQSVRDLPDDAALECAGLSVLPAELLVPLSSRGQLVGLIAFAARRRGVYGYGLRRALATCAPQLALALENAQLVAEGVMRERLAALGQLAAVIVHEVKNPLGIIKVAAGTLRKRVTDHGSAELAACVEDEVDRMDATVRRLLELARPPQPSLQPCDVGQVIRQTLDRLRPELASSGILVSTELGDAPSVSADAEELRRALLNLFLNAREAMPSGGTLRVRLTPADGRLEIDVEDSGHGMDEATRRQLFRPFFTTRHGGTGLGLAIVKRIVEDHKGAIRVESRPGSGARFTVSLPV